LYFANSPIRNAGLELHFSISEFRIGEILKCAFWHFELAKF
jgi:hypothetical protein